MDLKPWYAVHKLCKEGQVIQNLFIPQLPQLLKNNEVVNSSVISILLKAVEINFMAKDVFYPGVLSIFPWALEK